MLNFLALMGWDHHSALEELAKRQDELLVESGSKADTASAEVSAAADSTDIPDDGPLLPPLTRSDSHSYYDLFTPGQLIAAFSLEHVNHRKAAVSISKLDFINKLTLRRKAGRLGADGTMVQKGKEALSGAADEGEEFSEDETAERGEMILRVQAALRQQKVLKGK